MFASKYYFCGRINFVQRKEFLNVVEDTYDTSFSLFRDFVP